MKMKRFPLLLILLSYPLSLLLAALLTLFEYGLAQLLTDTVWIELYPMVIRSEAIWFFFISLNLIAVLWFFHKRNA